MSAERSETALETRHARLLLAIVAERWPEAEALARRGVDATRFLRLCREADVPKIGRAHV